MNATSNIGTQKYDSNTVTSGDEYIQIPSTKNRKDSNASSGVPTNLFDGENCFTTHADLNKEDLTVSS